MKRYTNQYRNQQWLYDVYRAVDSHDYILVAVVMGVGMYDIAMRLTEQEVETLRRSEDEFTQIVVQFLRGRDLPKYKSRRIENQIENLGLDEIALANSDMTPPTDNPVEAVGQYIVVRGHGQAGSTVLTLMALLLTGGLFAAVSCTREYFNRIFVDFDTNMPAITEFVRSLWFVWIVAVLFGFTIIKGALVRNRAVKSAWNNIAIVAVLVLGSLYVVGMFLPLTRILNLRT